MNRYEQWRANPSSVQPQAPVSRPAPQPLVRHRSINSHGTNTPTSASTPSSSRSRASTPSRSRLPSPYYQSPHEDERVRRERVDSLVREEPRWSEEVYAADGARAEQWHAHGDDTRWRLEWEEEGRCRMAVQLRIEQDAIIRRQREADHAAQAMRLGQSTGQNQAVTIAPVAPSSSVQYPSQMPLESPIRFVTHKLVHAFLVLNELNTDQVPKSPINRESHSSLGYARLVVDMIYPYFSPIQPITTASPLPPQLGTIQYPTLMSQHQTLQGYDPFPTGQLPPGFVPHDVLKTVSFPRYCLNRFTSIALINTARNRETCGLLLGKDKGERYVVTTLLIPKQHATSDTCTIDDEELVMQFTEERSLITLGWVRLHIF